MFPAPAWIPYRWRAFWDQTRINFAIRGIRAAKPIAAQSPANAAAEIHMLVCRRDLLLAVLALKSLLRFPDSRFAVSLTNDGSLSAADQALIDQHVPGCRWIARRTDDEIVRNSLLGRPALEALYRSNFNLVCKIIHPRSLARCERVIVLDADTAFFEQPQFLIEWSRGGDPNAYYLRDVAEKEVHVPTDVKQAFSQLSLQMSGRSEWSFESYYFNSGLLLFRPEQCNLDLTETYLTWLQGRRDKLREEPYFWFGDWTREQTAYMVMFAHMQPTARPLGTGFHLGAFAGGGFNHFMRDYLIRPSTLRALRQLIREMTARTKWSDR